MIKFGTWSIALLLGSLHGLSMAALLFASDRNRLANRCLATLLVLVVLLVTPYTIGYAGFYDAYPWLTFAPFFWQLGFGPLIYLYVRQLGTEAMPRAWGWHFLPLAIEVGYYAAIFCLPQEAKWRWNDTAHLRWVLPVQNLATLASLATYLSLALRHYRRYQAWLADNAGAREEYRLAWLRGFLVAIGATLGVALGFGVVDRWLHPLSYFDEFPLYVVFTLLVYYLGLAGWRHARDAYPRMERSAEASEPIATRDPPQRDWPLLGARYRQRVVESGWWREPDIGLAELARRLGTNTHYLSRALNEGLGMNFSSFVNGLRVEAAQRELATPGDILGVALAVGFRSKASFNRVFKEQAGCTPSEWRSRIGAARPIA